MAEHAPDLIAIHNSFAATEFGQRLASKVRYERYKPLEVPNDRWVKLLGADVNNLTHLTLTYGLARAFAATTERLRPGELTRHEQVVLQVAALIHDWAEAIVGDISFGDKTTAHEVVEKSAFAANLAKFYQGNQADLIEEARSEVIFDHDSRLGRMFNSIERVGYMRIALRAQDRIKHHEVGNCEPGLRWLVADVLLNQIPTLAEHSAEYPAVRQYVFNQRLAITAAFGATAARPEIFESYGSDRDVRQRDFVSSYDLWLPWAGSASAA